jgi:hypothetical protein
MKLGSDLFGWLEDLGILEQADASERTKRGVVLSEEVGSLFCNGLLVYDLFDALRLVEAPVQLRDKGTPQARLNNWNVLLPLFEAAGAPMELDAKVRRCVRPPRRARVAVAAAARRPSRARTRPARPPPPARRARRR